MTVTVGGNAITQSQADQLLAALGLDPAPVTTVKPTPVGADRVVLLDSAAGFAPVLATLATLPGGGGAGALVTVTHNGGGANPVTGDTLTAAFATGYTGSVQWQRNGTNIAGATNPTYMAVSADEGTTVRPQITSLIYTATGLPVGAPAATVPGAFVNVTDWNAAATSTAGEMQYQINSLPSNGGSPITALEYRVNTGSAIALSGTGTGNRTVTAGWSAGTAADTQVRAVNAIGPGPWSAPPLNRTPASGASAAIVASGTSSPGFGSSFNITVPAGTLAGHRLLVIFDSSSSVASVTDNQSTSYSSLTPASAGATDRIYVCAPIGATVPTTITVTLSSGAFVEKADVFVLSGATATLANHGTFSTGGSTDPRSHAYTTTGSNQFVFGRIDFTAGGVTGATGADGAHTWRLNSGSGYLNTFAGVRATSGSYGATLGPVGAFSASTGFWFGLTGV